MIHWTIPFKSLDKSNFVINIYDSSYSGSPVTLQGGGNPFSVKEDDSNDFFSPIRTQTGYIKIVANNSFSKDILAINKYSRKVEVLKNDSLYWRGYIQPDMFSQNWASLPYEIELPVQSQLAVISSDRSQTYSDRCSFSDILSDMFRSASYDYVVFPYDWNDGDQYPLNCRATTSHLTEDTFENKSLIEDFLNFWSLQLREKGDTLYFIGRHGCKYNKWSWTDFWNNNSPFDEYYSEQVALSSLQNASNRNKVDILPPYRHIKITADYANSNTDVNGIDREKMVYSGKTEIKTGSSGRYPVGCDRAKKIYYYPSEGNVQFYSWNNTKNAYGQSNSWHAVTWSATHAGQGGVTASAGWSRCDVYKYADITSGTKNTFTYNDYVVLLHQISYFEDQSGEYGDYNAPTDAEALQYPLMRILLSKTFYATEGAFVLKGNFSVNQIGANGDGTGTLQIMLKCGDKYYNGSSWTTTKSKFSVAVENYKIKSTKTIDDKYNNATDGRLIPINTTLYGPLELYVLMNTTDNLGCAYYISGFELAYCEPETYILKKDNEGSNVYQSTITSQSSEDIDKTINMASFVDGHYGLATVMKPNGLPLSTLYAKYSSSSLRPESAIVELAKTELSQPREKITVTVKETDINPNQQVTYNNKIYNINSMSHELSDSEMTLSLIQTRVTQESETRDITTRTEVEQCVSTAASTLWQGTDITLASWDRDRFSEWLSDIGIISDCVGNETQSLRSALYALYPSLNGCMILSDDREDCFSGQDIVDAICTQKNIT